MAVEGGYVKVTQWVWHGGRWWRSCENHAVDVVWREVAEVM